MSRSLPPTAPLRRRPVRAAAAALVLVSLLGGCSGTRFGDALSRSFSAGNPAGNGGGSESTSKSAPGSATASTAAPAPGPASSAAGPAAASPAGASPASPVAPDAKAGKPTAAASPTAAAGNPAVSRAATTANPVATVQPPRPAPYRVTILLPQADAAAPAEVVTQALRAAGVPFEVETIERLGRSTGTTSPQQAPVSRPAPEPR